MQQKPRNLKVGKSIEPDLVATISADQAKIEKILPYDGNDHMDREQLIKRQRRIEKLTERMQRDLAELREKNRKLKSDNDFLKSMLRASMRPCAQR